MIGDSFGDYHESAGTLSRNDVVLLGVCSWDSVAGKENLISKVRDLFPLFLRRYTELELLDTINLFCNIWCIHASQIHLVGSLFRNKDTNDNKIWFSTFETLCYAPFI